MLRESTQKRHLILQVLYGLRYYNNATVQNRFESV
jgi:hypothetical protein